MFERGSRYERVPQAVYTAPDGRGIAYVLLRLTPETRITAAHAVVEGDRLDVLAGRYFGDPEQFWRIADANVALRPDDLTAVPRSRIMIPLGGV